MSLEDKELMQFKVGKKEQYAARIIFFVAGFGISTWAPMIPIIKERLQIGADILGLLLLCIGVSSFLMMPIAGLFAQKFGGQRGRRKVFLGHGAEHLRRQIHCGKQTDAGKTRSGVQAYRKGLLRRTENSVRHLLQRPRFYFGA